MGKILKEDFNGDDLKKKIEENPENADYFASFMNDADYLNLSIDEMLQKAYELKIGVYPYYTKAMEIYKYAAEKGSAEAKYRIAEMYKEGEGVEQNFKEAAMWYEAAGNSGYKTGWPQAGRIYYHGEEGFPQDRSKAVECFKKTSDAGDGDEISNYYLGIEYLKGGAAGQDYEKAFSCFDYAAAQGRLEALSCIEYMFETGKVKNCKYKTAAEWYTGTNKYGKAAEQLAYVYIHCANFLADAYEYHKRTISVLPEESLLSQVIKTSGGHKDAYGRGIYWYEASAETNYDNALYSLVYLYYYNRYNKIERPPDAEKIERLVNKFFTVDEKSKKIAFNIKDCNELIYKFMGLSAFSLREGLLSLEGKTEKEKNFFIKTGLKLVSEGIDYDIIKTILDFMLETEKKEGIDKIARKIIAQGIYSVQSADNPETIRMKLFEIFADDIFALEQEWKKIIKKSKNAGNYFARGMIFYNQKKLDAAAADFQTAVKLTKDADEKVKCVQALADVYGDIQRGQTLEERMAPYAQMIEKMKNETKKPILKTIKLKTKEEVTELTAALALFEEYDLLKRLLKESSGSLLNNHVRQQFAFWGPSPLYFITTKKVWAKMKDPKKMLKFLIDIGADVNAAAANGSTPLLNQTFTGVESVEIMETLLELGADPNKSSFINYSEDEFTPLVYCLWPIYIEEESEEEDSGYYIPFNDLAVKQAKLLLEYGADPNLTTYNTADFPPLIMAIRYGFITEDGPSKGESPSDILELIELLIKKGSDVNFTDSTGNTPLSLAQKNNLSAAEEILKKHGAITYAEILERQRNLDYMDRIRSEVCP